MTLVAVAALNPFDGTPLIPVVPSDRESFAYENNGRESDGGGRRRRRGEGERERVQRAGTCDATDAPAL